MSAEERRWESRLAGAEPTLDAAGQPALRLRVDGDTTGVARSNILNNDDTASDFTVGLVEARLREELKPATLRKTARSDVQNDLLLLQHLLTLQARGLAGASASEASYGTQRAPANDSAARSNPIP